MKSKSTAPINDLALPAEAEIKLLTPAEFAQGMPFTVGTLNNSRLTGRLMGVVAPRHFRFGRIVRYPATERQAWLDRFELAASSAEHFAKK